MFKTLGGKVLFTILTGAFVGAALIYLMTGLGYRELSDGNARKTLTMLGESIFQTIRLSMFSGDRIVIEDALRRANAIEGVHSLKILPDKEVIATFDLKQKQSDDPAVLRVFSTRESSWHEIKGEDGPHVRLLKPMIAEPVCVKCHILNQVNDVLGVMDLDISTRWSDEVIKMSLAKLGIFLSAALLLAIALSSIFARGFSAKLAALQTGLLEFFGFLNQTKRRASPIEIKSGDELGQMAKAINDNIARVEIGLEKDRKFIREATQIVSQVNSGFVSGRLVCDARNPALVALRETINAMIAALERNIDEILRVMRSYESDDYTAAIAANRELGGELKALNDGVNRLGDSIGRMLGASLENGKSLEENAKELGGHVRSLSAATNSQAEALRETSEAVTAITAAIRDNAKKASLMADIAAETHNSAREGSALALDTMGAMEQIVRSANAIGEAIGVIDAIAFQTNILSLNAAVEAATAGEAGKGFAVVAGEVRNLAARSADAARTIKELSEESRRRADEGKEISALMMKGYEKLSGKVEETSALVSQVAQASRDQMGSIEHINEVFETISQMTQESAQVAKKTRAIAERASEMARALVSDASDKKFRGSFAREDIDLKDDALDDAQNADELLERSLENETKAD